jgi:hypothetical protein
LCELDLLDPDTLRERIRSAWPFHTEGSDKDDDPDAERAFSHCEIVCTYLNTGVWNSK